MKKNKFLNNLESELQNHYKDKMISKADGLLAVLIFLIFVYKLKSSSYIFFYSNYILYAIFLFILLCRLLCYFFSKKWKITIPTNEYSYLMPTLVVMISFWIIPRVWHFIGTTKKEICINAKLTSKREPYGGQDGVIWFDIRDDKIMPRELRNFNLLSNLSYDEYRDLPKKGGTIKICGEISKVGYQYTSIEAIK